MGCKLGWLSQLQLVHAAGEGGYMVRGVRQCKGVLDAGQRLKLQIPFQGVQLHSTDAK